MYKIINDLPSSYGDFATKPKKEARLYEKWFNENKDIRLNELKNEICATRGFEDFAMNYTPESLLVLGEWLESSVQTEKLSKEEYKEKRKNIPEYIEINDWDLTIKTYSLLFDAGIYFGEVFIHNYDGLSWKQDLKNKRNLSYGHMLISGQGLIGLNPVTMIIGSGRALAGKRDENSKIYELYHIWSEDKMVRL